MVLDSKRDVEMSLSKRLLQGLRTKDRPVRWFVSRVVAFSGLGRLVTIDRGLFRIRLFPTGMSLGAWDDPIKYREDEAFLRSHIKPGESVIDVGANVGFVALAAAALTGPTGSVLAFEAHPATFRYLKRNVRLNRFRNVRLVWAAVGNAAGYVHFSSKANDDVNLVSEKGIRVPVVRIDDVVDEQGQIALLKVDVEGYEKFVFEGARLTLQRVRSIYFEVCDTHFATFGYTTYDLLGILQDYGFQFFRIHRDGTRTPVSRNFRPPTTMNLLAVKAH